MSAQATGNPNPTFQVLAGFALGIACHGVWWILALALNGHTDFYIFIFFGALSIGITQWIYLLPLFLWLRHRGVHLQAKGVVIAGAVTMLLNTACWGWLAITKPRIGG